MGIPREIRWNPADNETVAAKYLSTSGDDRFSTKSRLVVSTGQEAVVVVDGTMEGPFRPGGHRMDAESLPVLAGLRTRSLFSSEATYSAEVWFVQVSSPPDFPWGTPTPVAFGAKYDSNGMRWDLTAGVTMYGAMALSIADTRTFLETMVQTKALFTRSDLHSMLNDILMQTIKPALARYMKQTDTSIRDITLAQDQIGEIIFEDFKEELAKYGLKLFSFKVADIRLTPETDRKIHQLDEQASVVVVKDLERRTLGASPTPVGLKGTMPPPPTSPGRAPVPPSVEYMIAQDGKTYGPFPAATIAQWIREGSPIFHPGTMIWREGWPAWVKYEECKGLFPGLDRPAGMPPPPLPN